MAHELDATAYYDLILSESAILNVLVFLPENRNAHGHSIVAYPGVLESVGLDQLMLTGQMVEAEVSRVAGLERLPGERSQELETRGRLHRVWISRTLVSNSIRQPVMSDERCLDKKQQVQRIGSYDHARRSVSVATVLRFNAVHHIGGKLSYPRERDK